MLGGILYGHIKFHNTGGGVHSGSPYCMKKNQGVFVKHYAPAATESEKAILARRSKSRSQVH